MNRLTAITLTTLLLAGCGGGGGGGGGGGTTTAAGTFVDAPVQGLSYVSGGQSGVTGAGGSFTYEVGNTVTFSLGGVTLGQATGDAVISPVDLVSGGSPANAAVQNIVRFLMTLDDDGDPANGITISTEVRTAAEEWSAIDFSAAGIDTDLATVAAAAIAADGGAHDVPTTGAAQTHLTQSLYCAYSGAFRGSYAGDSTGVWGIVISAVDGSILGVGYDNTLDELFDISGGTALSLDADRAFVAGDVSVGASFSGSMGSFDSVSGTWQETTYFDGNGTFSGGRVTPSSMASPTYRATGHYIGDFDGGFFTVDIDDSGTVQGAGYSVASDEPFTITGTYAVGTGAVSGTTSNGATFSTSFAPDTGALSGTWANTDASDSGIVNGSGCAL